MTTSIQSSADVAVGDLVEFHAHSHFATPPAVGPCVVVRAGKASLTVRGPDGTEFRKAYTITYRSRGWRGGTNTHHNFRRLDAMDRWLRERPVVSLSVVANTGGFSSVVLTADDLRSMTRTCAHLAVLAAWIDRMPKNGAR